MHIWSCIYFMHCNWKNVNKKHTNTNLFKDLSGNTLTWNISLILIPYSSYKNLFRLNIFAIYFPLLNSSFSRSIFFRLELFLFIKRKLFLLLWKELMLIISIINASLNIDWLASFSSCKLLIGLFEFNRKPVEAASYKNFF